MDVAGLLNAAIPHRIVAGRPCLTLPSAWGCATSRLEPAGGWVGSRRNGWSWGSPRAGQGRLACPASLRDGDPQAQAQLIAACVDVWRRGTRPRGGAPGPAFGCALRSARRPAERALDGAASQTGCRSKTASLRLSGVGGSPASTTQRLEAKRRSGQATLSPAARPAWHSAAAAVAHSFDAVDQVPRTMPCRPGPLDRCHACMPGQHRLSQWSNRLLRMQRCHLAQRTGR